MLKGKGKIRFLGLILMLVCLVQPVSAQAVSYAPYATYTYSLDQEHFMRILLTPMCPQGLSLPRRSVWEPL